MLQNIIFSYAVLAPASQITVYRRHHASLSDRIGLFMIISQKKFKNKIINKQKQEKIKVELMDESINN